MECNQSVSAALAAFSAELAAAGIENAAQETRWMVEYLVGGHAQFLRTEVLTAEQLSVMRAMVRRRTAGEPFQYILGETEFHCIRLSVGVGCLIPRPETEELVERVVDYLNCNRLDVPVICDVCTGSGAIALALAKTVPRAHVHAGDISEEALDWARRNKSQLRLENVRLYRSDLFRSIPEDLRFDVITANPPYVSQEDYVQLDTVVRNYEPRLALVAEDHGLAIIRRLAREAKPRLNPSGCVFCEIGDEQGSEAVEIFRSEGYVTAHVFRDISGKDRILFAGNGPFAEAYLNVAH